MKLRLPVAVAEDVVESRLAVGHPGPAGADPGLRALPDQGRADPHERPQVCVRCVCACVFSGPGLGLELAWPLEARQLMAGSWREQAGWRAV
jgi:hypothetical protein